MLELQLPEDANATRRPQDEEAPVEGAVGQRSAVERKLPLYVQRDFLAKLFALCALQLSMCLVTALVVHAAVKNQVPNVDDGDNRRIAKVLLLPARGSALLLGEYYSLCIVTTLLMWLLWRVRSQYPRNYIYLAVMTLCVGSFWGVSSASLAVDQHMYLLALIIITLGTASLVCRMLLREKGRCSSAASALAAASIGWLVGFVFLLAWSLCLTGLSDRSHFLSAAILSTLSLLFIFYYTWQSLKSTSADDLVGLVAVVNASALAAISLPYLILLLACCAPSALPSASDESQGDGLDLDIPDAEQGRAPD